MHVTISLIGAIICFLKFFFFANIFESKTFLPILCLENDRLIANHKYNLKIGFPFNPTHIEYEVLS